MKAILLSLALALLMFGCGEPKVLEDTAADAVDTSKLQVRNGLTYLPNEETPFTGRAERFYENGKKVSEEYMDGKLDGTARTWHANGQREGEINFKTGERDGLWTMWYANGQKQKEGNHKDGKLVGLLTEYNKDGQKEFEGHYKDGKQDGPAAAWHDNGQKALKGNYREDKPNGLWTLWYENGEKKSETTFKNGKLKSAVVWKPNVEKCPVTNLKDGNGVVVGYNMNGTEKIRRTYKDGKLVKY